MLDKLLSPKNGSSERFLHKAPENFELLLQFKEEDFLAKIWNWIFRTLKCPAEVGSRKKPEVKNFGA
jgi:hypothetical protein